MPKKMRKKQPVRPPKPKPVSPGKRTRPQKKNVTVQRNAFYKGQYEEDMRTMAERATKKRTRPKKRRTTK